MGSKGEEGRGQNDVKIIVISTTSTLLIFNGFGGLRASYILYTVLTVLLIHL